MNTKPIHVAFASLLLEKKFNQLKNGTYEERHLYASLERAIGDLKVNPMSGKKIPRRLWPRSYTKRYQLTNLWKYNLPHAWRMIYTIYEDHVMILNIILEWFPHKDYERIFNF